MIDDKLLTHGNFIIALESVKSGTDQNASGPMSDAGKRVFDGYVRGRVDLRHTSPSQQHSFSAVDACTRCCPSSNDPLSLSVVACDTSLIF